MGISGRGSKCHCVLLSFYLFYPTRLNRKSGFTNDISIILPKNSLDTKHSNTPLFIIDWELAQCGTRALDLGQMMAELYELKHYKDIDAGVWIIQGITEGYPALSDEMAFRTLIHVGTHLIFFGSTVPGWGTDEQIADVVRLGKDLIVKAWEKDKSWFKGLVWECLFKK